MSRKYISLFTLAILFFVLKAPLKGTESAQRFTINPRAELGTAAVIITGTSLGFMVGAASRAAIDEVRPRPMRETRMREAQAEQKTAQKDAQEAYEKYRDFLLLSESDKKEFKKSHGQGEYWRNMKQLQDTAMETERKEKICNYNVDIERLERYIVSEAKNGLVSGFGFGCSLVLSAFAVGMIYTLAGDPRRGYTNPYSPYNPCIPLNQGQRK